jgi:hypothetical protein
MYGRYFIIIVFLTVLSISSRGQDLIITTLGDSIKCKIIDIGTDYIVVEDEDEQRLFIQRRRVAKIDYDYYSKEHKIPPPKTDWSIIRACFDGGFSLLTGKVKDTPIDELRDYYKRLKTGWVFGVSGTYYIKEYLGFGLKYTLMKSWNKEDNLTKNVMDGPLLTGIFKSNVSIHYIGPEVSLRYYLPDTKFCFFLDFGMGLIRYANKESFADNNSDYSESYKITGNNMGLSIGLSADYLWRNDYGFGLGISYTYGKIGSYEVDNSGTIEVIGLSEKDRQNLSHFDVTIGFRWSYL